MQRRKAGFFTRLLSGKAAPAKTMPGFDIDFYNRRNPDVAATRQDPLEHYLTSGWKEGREPSAGFQGQAYLQAHPDVKAAGVNPLVHFLDHGLAEGRAWTEGTGWSSQPAGSAPSEAKGPVRAKLI